MKERIKQSGMSVREEMIRDSQNLLNEELEHDASYSPTIYFYNPDLRTDGEPGRLRIYNRKYSSLNGNYQSFLTTYDNPVKIGEYFHDKKDDTYWLVYNSFNVNDTHYEGKLIQCNYLLKWQTIDGRIVERHANIVSASKYDVGENGNYIMKISSNNYTVLIGYCEEGFDLEGQRVFIDMKKENPTKVFKMTRSDDVIYNSDGVGRILGFIADKTQFNPDTDNQELRICDYKKPPLPPLHSSIVSNLISHISGNKNLIIDFPRTYTVNFTDKDNFEIDWKTINFQWNIVSDFNDSINTIINGNEIKLFVDDENLLDEKLKLQVLVDGTLNSEIIVTVSEIS